MTELDKMISVAAAAQGAVLPLRIRVVSPHASYLHEHLARLDDKDRRTRLGRPVATGAIEAYCTRARCAEPVILGGFVDGCMVASAELFALRDDRFDMVSHAAIADMLIVVEKPSRRRGLAGSLAKEIIRHAASERIALVRMLYDSSNRPMARISKRFGAVHSQTGTSIRAEVCTGWLADNLAQTLIERAPPFRPLIGY